MRRIGILFFSMLVAGCVNAPPRMVFKQVNLGSQRIKLTKRYLCKQYKKCHGSILIHPSIIMLTWVKADNWRQLYQRYRQPSVEGKLNQSVHYIVATDGRVYQLMPNNWMANYNSSINDSAVVIANVDAPANDYVDPFAQQQSDIFLVKMLQKQYRSISYLASPAGLNCLYRYGVLSGKPQPLAISATQRNAFRQVASGLGDGLKICF